jgi:hypothetical protein
MGALLGQREMEGRTLAGRAIGPHAAAVTDNDALHEREADTRAREIRGVVQPLKHSE